jgi:hypothetical protein
VSEPVLPDVTSDEREVGWGDDPTDAAPDPHDEDEGDLEARLREDRPPHYDRD